MLADKIDGTGFMRPSANVPVSLFPLARWILKTNCFGKKGQNKISHFGRNDTRGGRNDIFIQRVQIFCLIFFLSFLTCSNGFGQTSGVSIINTWLEQNEQVFGARPGENGPIGGGAGYQKIVTQGDHHVKNVDGLLVALKSAKAGDVIFIDGRVEIDCTDLVFTEKLQIQLPAGVTLASDRGHKGSEGAIIRSDNFATLPLIKAIGPNIRITGLRIIGPDPKPRLEHHRRSFNPQHGDRKAQKQYYYLFPNSRGISTDFGFLEVDNCELSGWSHAAIFLQNGSNNHIHHNYIHHNQRNGLGYGVSHGYGKNISSLIEFNLFNYNRHSIAGTGVPGLSYEARNNIELGESLSHNFDMHGGGDRRDGTYIAGERILIHHNTFTNPQVRAIAIRGRPTDKAEIYNNWFAQEKPGKAVLIPWPVGPDKNVLLYNNAFGRNNPVIIE